MAYVELAKLHEIADGFMRPVRLAGKDLLLLQELGRLYLIANECPHRQAPLTRATLTGIGLRCPSHGIEFSLQTGRALNSTDCAAGLTFYPLVYEGATVGVELNDQ
ncbi:Rieske (2Fe-2S) protein [Gilvimarinus polysaccharolyticus]|uniref:Rieske (2Fe-2S) protein n=1 Tax=Gilvimarinus polysaccharolyticus TaxID=863921 RepID=UPI0006730C74|nr:Rieske 2Fe-2S domain-containing protein [Gilvimarinus polysaccharolyticus]